MLGFVVLVHGRLIGQRSDLFKICGSTSLVSAQQPSKIASWVAWLLGVSRGIADQGKRIA